MIRLSPNPRNRLYTSLNSYRLFVGYALAGRFNSQTTEIERFEAALCRWLSVEHVACVYQCRVGIYLAVKALIKPGQEVVLSPYTLTDVVNMVIFAGGKPVFADVDRQTCNISAVEVERLIGPNTGAVLITHLHGLAAAAHHIKEICDRASIPLIEDAAQAFGAYEHGQPLGTIGDVGVFSFEMHKNLPTWLGGAVVSRRADVLEKIRQELEHFNHPPIPGIVQKVKKGLIHDIAGLPILFQLFTYPLIRFSYLNNFESLNKLFRRKPQVSAPAAQLPDIYKSRYTPFQARLGLSQLPTIERDIKTRIEYSCLYYEGLKDIADLRLPPMKVDGSHTYLWFPVQSARREELLRYMFQRRRDIAAGHFTCSARSPQFQQFARDCPNSASVEQELFYLPTYPRYSRLEVEQNIQVIREFFGMQPVQVSGAV